MKWLLVVVSLVVTGSLAVAQSKEKKASASYDKVSDTNRYYVSFEARQFQDLIVYFDEPKGQFTKPTEVHWQFLATRLHDNNQFDEWAGITSVLVRVEGDEAQSFDATYGQSETHNDLSDMLLGKSDKEWLDFVTPVSYLESACKAGKFYARINQDDYTFGKKQTDKLMHLVNTIEDGP